MQLIYLDESGDTKSKQENKRSSDLFCISSVAININDYDLLLNEYYDLRKVYQDKGLFNIKEEFHTTKIVNRNKPFDHLTNENVKYIFNSMINLLVKHPIISHSIIINKTIADSNYQIFNNAANYLLTRIDFFCFEKNEKYLVFCDKGYEDKWNKVLEKVKVGNLVKSTISSKDFKKIKICNVIERIIPRDSIESEFIQIADFMVFIINQWYRIVRMNKKNSKSNIFLTEEYILEILKKLKVLFNTKVHYGNEYGILIYPRGILEMNPNLNSSDFCLY